MNVNHFRKVFIALASCTAIASMAVFAQSKTTNKRGEVTSSGGLVLIAKPQKASYDAGQPAIVAITLKNNGTIPRNYTKQNVFVTFKLRVFTSTGQAVPLTLYGKRTLSSGAVVSYRAVGTLKPEEEYKIGFIMNRLYDMTLGGNYKVQVLMSVAGPKGDGYSTLVSNVTAIKVNDVAAAVDI